MEIIEIPDDIGDSELGSFGSSGGERGTSASSGIEYISNSSSQLDRDAAEDHLLGRPPPNPVVDDNDLWDYRIPEPHAAPEPNFWTHDMLGPDLEVAEALRQFGQLEPDWQDFLDNENSAGIQRNGGNNGATSSSQSIIETSARPKFPHEHIDRKIECVDDVVSVFPDICRDYVSGLYDSGFGEIAEQLVAHILDKADNGSDYPKVKDKLRTLKRKREVDEDEEATNKYGNINREYGSHDYSTLTRSILSGEFVYTPMVFIDSTLRQTRNHLFPAYMILEEAERNWDPAQSVYNKIKKPRTSSPYWTPETVEATLSRDESTADTMLALRELQAVRRVRKKADEKRRAEMQAELDEEENLQRAKADGTMLDCGCCFEQFPLNRMVHCNHDSMPHWFCRACAKQTAETEIGNSKYKIKCMSMDDCDCGFSREMKTHFLDEKLSIAMDRNEQEEMLRLAGIENLASCPFCPFAAEYPPVEEDREFRCQAPDCERVSCRLCNLESHIPKTCEESAKENGLSVRRQIEEAMSAAIIRTCNKCGTPFIKEEGCNKMTCTRSGCYNVQCYVCSKSCSYDHFNDRSRGGKAGNCPLFESVEERHQEEVNKAEKEALERVRAEHPEYTEEDLKVKVSANVRQDEERRKANDPKNLPQLAGLIHRRPPAGAVAPELRARRPRHRVEARHLPPQVLAQDLGVWPPAQDDPHWQYGRENPPPPPPGINQKIEAPAPAPWAHNAEGELPPPDPRSFQIFPEYPVQRNVRVQQPLPGVLRAGRVLQGWNYEPEAGIPYDNDLEAVLGFLEPLNDEPAPAPLPGNFDDAERGYPYAPPPLPNARLQNVDVHHGVYDGGIPNIALNRIRELRLRQVERAQIHASQQRPA